MSGPVPEGSDLTDASLDEWVAGAEKMAARYQQLSADVGRVSVTETTPDSMISVTVNSAGLVTELRIADRATEMPAAKIAAGVMFAMRRAQSKIAGRVAEVMKAEMPDDQEMTDAVLTRYQTTFPPPPEPQVQARPAAVEEVHIGGNDEPQLAPQRPAAPAPQRMAPARPVAPAPQRVAPARRPSAAAADDFDGGNSFMEDVDR